MRLGVCILPELRWPEQRRLWHRAEELGFDHAWTYDHLAWRSLADGPWFGAIPTLTAAALATSRMRLGPLVASPNYRHPVPFDQLAKGGRVPLPGPRDQVDVAHTDCRHTGGFAGWGGMGRIGKPSPQLRTSIGKS